MRHVQRVLRWVALGRSSGVRAHLRRRLGAFVSGWREARPPSPEPEVPRPDPALGADVCGSDELLPGQIAEFVIEGVAIAVANVGGSFHAVANACPHAGGPLGDGEMEGAMVACPLHGWRFDVRTGACEVVPDLSVAVYRVQVARGRVWVALPPV